MSEKLLIDVFGEAKLLHIYENDVRQKYFLRINVSLEGESLPGKSRKSSWDQSTPYEREHVEPRVHKEVDIPITETEYKMLMSQVEGRNSEETRGPHSDNSVEPGLKVKGTLEVELDRFFRKSVASTQRAETQP